MYRDQNSSWGQNTPQFTRNHWNPVWNQNSNQNYPIQQNSSFNSIGKNNGYREFSHSPSPIRPEYPNRKMIQQDQESEEQNHQETKKPPRIPTGVEELLDSYTYKKAKRFINNCDREHPSPQSLPDKPAKIDITVPTVTQVSGIFALYQVVRAGNFSKTAKNCFPELFPDHLEFLTINQESILSNYRFSSVPSLLIGDILAVKWAWLNSENAVAGEFQILERKISINRFFLPINRFEGVAYGIEGTVGLLYPKHTEEIGKTICGTIFEPFEVEKVGKCAPLIIGELAGNLKNPEMEELIFFENWQIFLDKHRQFFSTVSQGKSIIESIYSPEAPPPSRPRNSQKFLEKFLEPMHKMDFLTEFQKSWTTRMLQRNPLVLGITVDPIYSNLAISAYCMAQKWLGTHLVLAENSRKSMEIFENLLEISKGSKLKIRRYDYSNPNYSNPENYSNLDILITDCSSILEIPGKLKNVKSVQFDRIFGIPNEILGRIFVEFCDSWSFGFMENLEKIPENSGISGISGISERFETAIIGGKFEILDVRKDLDMEDLGF
ncbi:unnamed protein product [Caenorhabditis nigoni]